MKKAKMLTIALVLILVSIVVLFYPAWVKAKIGTAVVNHIVVYKQIDDYYKQHSVHPVRLSELALPNSDFVKKRIKYNNPAEGSGDEFIILQSSLYGYEINTQKNGKIYTLKDGRIVTHAQYP